MVNFLPIKFFDWNSILIKSSFETGARTYLVSKQGHEPIYFWKRGILPNILKNRGKRLESPVIIIREI